MRTTTLKWGSYLHLMTSSVTMPWMRSLQATSCMTARAPVHLREHPADSRTSSSASSRADIRTWSSASRLACGRRNRHRVRLCDHLCRQSRVWCGGANSRAYEALALLRAVIPEHREGANGRPQTWAWCRRWKPTPMLRTAYESGHCDGWDHIASVGCCRRNLLVLPCTFPGTKSSERYRSQNWISCALLYCRH